MDVNKQQSYALDAEEIYKFLILKDEAIRIMRNALLDIIDTDSCIEEPLPGEISEKARMALDKIEELEK